GLSIKRSTPYRERINEFIKFGVGQCTIDVAIKLGQITANIVRAQEHFQCASSAHQPRQSSHWSAAWNNAGANFPLRKDSLFATRKAHVACKCKLTSDAGCAAAD